MVWSVLSLVVLLGGTGVLFAVYGRWSARSAGTARRRPALSFRQPGEVALTPAQRATAWFFFVIAGLFLVQALLGAAAEHYRADLLSFFGVDLARLLPYNLARTWHVQLSLLWTAAGFLAAGIFLTPFIAGREPQRPGTCWSTCLFGAVVLVVVGSLVERGTVASTGLLGEGPLFAQQWEYLDLPRLWQVLLTIGLFVWIAIIYRGIRTRLKGESQGQHAVAVLLRRAGHPGVLRGRPAGRAPTTHLTVAEFWRFWVVHLWVEDFLELFTTVMVAYIFVMLGVVRGDDRARRHLPRRDPLLGGRRDRHDAPPLLLRRPGRAHGAGRLLLRGRGHPADLPDGRGVDLPAARCAPGDERSTHPFPHRWAVMFLVAVGFWNFVGAGIFGFLINLPIVSYYEIGTALTANHGHAAMMGVYGMLAVGLSLFALRYLIPEDRWPEKLAKICFWSLNIGLAWMVFVDPAAAGRAPAVRLGERRLLRGALAGLHDRIPATRCWSGCGCPVTCSSSSAAACRSCGSPGRACATPGAARPPTNCRRTCCSSRSSPRLPALQPRPDAAPCRTNVILVCGYSGFLLAVAYGFDVMARRVAVRAQRWRSGQDPREVARRPRRPGGRGGDGGHGRGAGNGRQAAAVDIQYDQGVCGRSVGPDGLAAVVALLERQLEGAHGGHARAPAMAALQGPFGPAGGEGDRRSALIDAAPEAAGEDLDELARPRCDLVERVAVVAAAAAQFGKHSAGISGAVEQCAYECGGAVDGVPMRAEAPAGPDPRAAGGGCAGYRGPARCRYPTTSVGSMIRSKV